MTTTLTRPTPGTKNGGAANVLRYLQARPGQDVWAESIASALNYSREQVLRYIAYLRRNDIDGAKTQLKVLVRANKVRWTEAVTVPNITVVAEPVAPQPANDQVGLCLEVFRVSKTGTRIAEGTDGQLYRVEPLGVEA